MDEKEYQEMKKKDDAERARLETEETKKKQEFFELRQAEMFEAGKMRINLASRVAAGLVSNPQMEAEAIAVRSLAVTDAILAHIRDEIQSLKTRY